MIHDKLTEARAEVAKKLVAAMPNDCQLQSALNSIVYNELCKFIAADPLTDIAREMDRVITRYITLYGCESKDGRECSVCTPAMQVQARYRGEA